MLEGIRLNDFNDGNRIARAAGTSFNPLVDRCITRVSRNGDELLGGVVYRDWTGIGGSIAMHVASFREGWINRTLLWICFDYPFNQLKVKKIFGQVPEWNTKAYEFDKHLGFQDEAVIQDVYPQGNMMLLSMTRDQCRFLKMAPRALARGNQDGW
jgi:RimJ/RimL family protein N-acetyltransferase